jgi:hypothetical protein
MPPIRIQREIHQGLLSGNGIDCRCRVELVTKITPGFPPVRTLDIWIEKSPAEGNYKVFVNGATLSVRFARGAWREAAA